MIYVLKNFNYDLHIHSCLSPCGSDDMTPNNIVNMASIKNLNIIAVSDHNTVKNCRAVIKACENAELSLTVIPAVEINTSEDIHVLVYFRNIDAAEAFEREIIEERRAFANIKKIKNKPEIFGNQIIMNEFDEIIGEEENLLISAIDLSVDYIYDTAKEYNAVAVPAHINKGANGIIAILGSYPEYMGFKTVEINSKSNLNLNCADVQNKGVMQVISNSDAHYLWDIIEFDEPRDFAMQKITAEFIVNLLDAAPVVFN